MANSKSTDKKKQTQKVTASKQAAPATTKKAPVKSTAATKSAPAKSAASASAKQSAKPATKVAAQKKTASKSASVGTKSNEKKAVAASKGSQSAANSKPATENAQSGVKAYHISFRPEENRWQVKLGKGSRALKLFNTQDEAIDFAKEMAKSQEGFIVIHKLDGKMRKQRY